MPIISEIWHDANLFLQRIDSNIFEEISEDDTHSDNEIDNLDQCCAITNFKAGFLDTYGNLTKQILDLEIESYFESNVELVGLQVWRGALFLADYIIMHHESFQDKNILELAAGTGLTSLVAVIMNQKSMLMGNGSLICTDIDRGPILPLIESNFTRNSIQLKDSWDKGDTTLKVKVAEIDFFKEETYCNSILQRHDDIDIQDSNSKSENNLYCMLNRRLGKEDLENVDVIFAADVVYDEKITKAFFDCLYSITSQTLSYNKEDHDLEKAPKLLEIYLSIEKRCRVTALTNEMLDRKDSNDLNEECFIENKTSSDIFAPNYEVFIEELNTYINSHNNEKFCCRIEEIPISMVNQYFWSYERVEELVLFKLIVTCKYYTHN